MKAIWTGKARQDLEAIWTFIALDNIDAADSQIQLIWTASVILEDFPELGRIGKVPGTRELVVPGTAYRLIYRITSKALQILRVMHGAREWPPKH